MYKISTTTLCILLTFSILCIGCTPEEEKIVFVSYENEKGEIYTMNIQGENRVRLTDNDAYDSDPVWSPDGTQIAFSSNRDGRSRLYLMEADGTNQRPITNSELKWESRPQWSPNGNMIIFEGSDENMGTGIYMIELDTDETLYTPQRIIEGLEPSWSGDNQQVLFTANRDNGNVMHDALYIHELATGNETRFSSTSERGSFNNPQWSFDGEHIVFDTLRRPSKVFILHRETLELKQIVPDEADGIYGIDWFSMGDLRYEYQARWSRDGKRLIYVSYKKGEGGIYIYDLEKDSSVQLTDGTVNSGGSPDIWSPMR